MPASNLPDFNWFDILLLLTLLGSAFSGLRAGFARVVVGLCATIAGFLCASWFYRMAAEKLLPLVDNNVQWANLLGFFLIFAGILIVGAILAAILSVMFKWIGLSWFNHALGGAAGVLRGILVVTVMVDIIVAFTPRPTPSFLQQSRVLPYTNEISAWLISIAPRELKDSFDEQMNTIRQFWPVQHRHEHPAQV